MQKMVLGVAEALSSRVIEAPYPRLTSIVPIGTTDFSFYRPRLEIRARCDLREIETIIVDDGSPPQVSEEIDEFCVEHGFRHVLSGSPNQPFSLSRARNSGILAAKSEWVFMEDADIVYPTSSFQRLAEETCILDETPFNFLSVPTIYLAKKPSQRILQEGAVSDLVAQRLISKMLIASPLDTASGEDIQHFTPASGLILVRKRTAIGVGAYDESFNGWGGEDRDFIYRLLHANPLIDRPASFYATINTNLNRINEYKGWRSLFRIHGDYLAAKGIYAFHLFHPRMGWRNSTTTKTNIDLAAQKAAEIAKADAVMPYDQPDIPWDVILGANPHVANTQVYSALSNPKLVPEDHSVNPEAFATSLASHNPRVVIIWNPYGTEWRLGVYRQLRRMGVEIIVAERGALPWTLYFDSDMSITSSSYDEDRWNRPNSPEEEMFVTAYIDDLRYGDTTLEKQNNRIGAALLRHSLTIPQGTKVLFAPLQLETDTVTVHFSEPGRTYQDYIRALKDVSLRLPANWMLAYKNHPLNLTQTQISSAVCLDKYHIHDILEACDAVALFNSGTGVLSMAFEKPVFYFGSVFYRADGVNAAFNSAAHLRKLLTDLPSVDTEKVRRFFRYLTRELYSFADWKADLKRAQNGKAMVPKINYLYYRTLRIPGFRPVDFPPPATLSQDSVLMDRFRVQPVAPEPAKASPQPSDKRIPVSSKKGSLSARLAKLRRDPHAFFRDAHWSALRPLRMIFRSAH